MCSRIEELKTASHKLTKISTLTLVLLHTSIACKWQVRTCVCIHSLESRLCLESWLLLSRLLAIGFLLFFFLRDLHQCCNLKCDSQEDWQEMHVRCWNKTEGRHQAYMQLHPPSFLSPDIKGFLNFWFLRMHLRRQMHLKIPAPFSS